MKTWIIVLTIVFIVLKLVQTGLANYIRNDDTEKLKYHFMSGMTPLGITHSIVTLLGSLVLSADVILVVILLIEKL